MSEPGNAPPGLGELARKLLATALGCLQNRGELFALELREEKARVSELLVWTVAALFLAMFAVIMLTATIVLLFPQERRIYVAAGFTVLYLAGALWALYNARSLIRKGPPPFAETLAELKKDREWLDSLK